MNTTQLIARLQEIDPSGELPVVNYDGEGIDGATTGLANTAEGSYPCVIIEFEED